MLGRGKLRGQRPVSQGRYRHESHRGSGHYHDPLFHRIRHVPVDLQEVAKVVLVVGLRRPECVFTAGFLAGRGRGAGIQSRGADGPDVGSRGVLACGRQGSATQLRLVVS